VKAYEFFLPSGHPATPDWLGAVLGSGAGYVRKGRAEGAWMDGSDGFSGLFDCFLVFTDGVGALALGAKARKLLGQKRVLVFLAGEGGLL